MISNLWGLIRPYFTVTRVVTLITSLLTPIAAVVIGWLAMKLADAGISLDETEAMAVFISGVAAVLATVVPIVRKWLDGRAGFEKAMVEQGLAAEISSKSVASRKAEIEAATETPKDKTPAVGFTPETYPEPDDDYLLSQPDDVHPDDARELDSPK
jgi:hypothetical protein